MQQKVQERLNEITEKAEMELVDGGQWATNVGLWYVMDGFKNVLTIKYNFQQGYCSLTVTDSNAKHVWSSSYVPFGSALLKDFFHVVEVGTGIIEEAHG